MVCVWCLICNLLLCTSDTMAQKRLPLRPLTRSDIILRNAMEKNLQAESMQQMPKQQHTSTDVRRRLFGTENNIVTSTPTHHSKKVY